MPQQRRHNDRQQQLINEITRAATEHRPLKDKRQLKRYLSEYYRNISIDDVGSDDAKRLAQAALSHLRAARKLPDNEHLLRVYNPTEQRHGWQSSHTIVELVHRNMPFLVDSLSMTLDRLGYSIHLTIHPLIRCERTPSGQIRTIYKREASDGHIESFIRLDIRRETRTEQLAAISVALEATLADVRAAVRDWQPMREKMRESIADLGAQTKGDLSLQAESVALLEWLADDQFTFLGYREYRLTKNGNGEQLKPVRGSSLGVKTQGNRKARTQPMTQPMQRFKQSPAMLLMTKANARSTVHRPSYLDYIGIKTYDRHGRPSGERRFTGLLTSQAYNVPPQKVPLVRGKIDEILARTRLDPTGHRGKALIHILNNYPRDELFQASVSDLLRTATGILNLQDRRRVKFFIRRDTFRRYYSCLVFVPREKYNTQVRERTEQILTEALGATTIESTVQVSDSTLARVHILVHAPTDQKRHISIRGIERAIREAVITWSDKLRSALIDYAGEERGADLFERYEHLFPLAYEEDCSAQQACLDIEQTDALLHGQPEALSNFQLTTSNDGSGTSRISFRIFRRDNAIALSDALPLLENLGMRVVNERPYQLRIPQRRVWIQDFELQAPEEISPRQLNKAAKRFAEGFADQFAARTESDGYNRLILLSGLDSRQVSLLRAYTKHLLQLGLPFGQSYMEDILSRHPACVSALVDWFSARFDPSLKASARRITALRTKVLGTIRNALSLDADRALRALFSVMQATARCNFFWRDANGNCAEAIAFKLETNKIDEAPLPRPLHEIFVYSPRVEGVHLRAGDIARGGLRWSDRREDFRTEVLGLMKAQTVKNTVIVPTGAKGGFYPKQLPAGDRDAVMREVTSCYKIFIRALLWLTDDIVDSKIVAPDQLVCLDAPDPYLVVAADKGTATFSDTANAIAVKHGFWLGDAFASGGSAGYDHKKMAITARGAWEAVKRHFRELGTDTQQDPFTVVGIGDMSGDVFGNGMLLSPTIRLQAAFNHQHIFIDPDPDAATGFKERQRLFALPRSGWADYDTHLISKGGGVFARDAKSIALSEPTRAMLGTDAEQMTPPELIRLILKMPADLLWNGGIGTYVKASSESNTDVGDRHNDNLRINADELRCKVVGEGGNLGLTQLARVQFALGSGRINTDFIDNSAGVDSSDREVNIKILLRQVASSRRFTTATRNKLLAQMTDDVAALVLRNNYLQTQAISMMETSAAERISEHGELIRALERSGKLNRALEFVPDDEQLEERKRAGLGLTRPEISVVLSYAKLDLYERLSSQRQTLNDSQIHELIQYFPGALRRRFANEIAKHQLGFEIVTTLLTNSLVNRMGPGFAIRAELDTGYDIGTIAQSYLVAREITRARRLWHDIEQLDTRLPANIQYAMMFAIARKLRHASYWLMRTNEGKLASEAMIAIMTKPLQQVLDNLPELMSGNGRRHLDELKRQHARMGVAPRLAARVSALSFVHDALEIVQIAEQRQCGIEVIAKVYFAIGERLQLDWIRESIDGLEVDGRWQARARSTLRDNVIRAQRDLTGRVHSLNQCQASNASIDALINRDAASFERVDQLITQMREKSSTDFATMTVAIDELNQLTA